MSAALLTYAGWHVSHLRDRPLHNTAFEPARLHRVELAAVGVVEPLTECIRIGTSSAGIVSRVHVQVAQPVCRGEALFQLDNWDLAAKHAVLAAELAHAEAQAERLQKLPRPETLPPAAARVDEATAHLVDLQDKLARATRLHQSEAGTEEAVLECRQAVKAAEARLRFARAEYELLRAGAWEPELEVARAIVTRAQAAVEQLDAEIARRTVTAPLDGTVLQVNIRPGEYITSPSQEPLMVIGNITRLHLRVELDEFDVPTFDPDSPAYASVRGGTERYPLRFVRVEPRLIPKRSLRGDHSEWTDTRVIQLIYELPRLENSRLFVGQTLDVSIGPARGDEEKPR